jgi:hypothetical protein
MILKIIAWIFLIIAAVGVTETLAVIFILLTENRGKNKHE